MEANLFKPRFKQQVLIVSLRSLTLVVKFLTTLFIAKFIGIDSLGVFGLISAVCVVAPSLLGLSLMYSLSRRAVTQDPEEICLGMVNYTYFILLLYACISVPILIYAYFEHNLVFFSIVILTVFIEHLNLDIYGLLLNLSKPLLANVLHFIKSAMWMLVYMVSAFFCPFLLSLEYLLAFWITGSLVSFFTFVLFSRKWPWVLTPLSELFPWLRGEYKLSKLLFLNGILSSIIQYATHFLITLLLGLEMTGVYTLYTQALSAMSNLLQTGVIQLYRPQLVATYKSKNYSMYKKIFRKCLLDTMQISLLMMILAAVGMYVVAHYIIDKPLVIYWLPIFYSMLLVFFLANIKEVANLFFYSLHRDDLTFLFSLISGIVTLIITPIALYQLNLTGVAIVSIFNGVFILFLCAKTIPDIQRTHLLTKEPSYNFGRG